MTLRFRDTLTAYGGDVAEAAQTLPRIGSRFNRSRREKQANKIAIGFSLSPQEAVQTSDSESDLEEEEEGLRHGSLDSRTHRMPSEKRDGRQLCDDIDEMQDELDRLVRFIHREVEGLAGSASEATSAFNVLAFALEDWSR
jgi:gamma-tubulin complex component 5